MPIRKNRLSGGIVHAPASRGCGLATRLRLVEQQTRSVSGVLVVTTSLKGGGELCTKQDEGLFLRRDVRRPRRPGRGAWRYRQSYRIWAANRGATWLWLLALPRSPPAAESPLSARLATLNGQAHGAEPL